MILFVVFGLPMISAPATDPIPAAIGQVAPDKLQEAISFHRDQGLRIRILDYGAPAVPPNGPVAGRDAIPAKYETFGRIDPRSPESVDFGKQILTAVITLLTSVVSFYFGSRAVTDGTAPAAPGGAGGDPAADRKRIDSAWNDLAGRIAALGARVDKAPADTQARQAALTALAPLRKRIEDRKAEIDQHLAAANAALILAAAAAGAEAVRQSNVASAQLAAAESLMAAAEADQTAYGQAVDKLEKA
jgi:hypothetical protein